MRNIVCRLFGHNLQPDGMLNKGTEIEFLFRCSRCPQRTTFCLHLNLPGGFVATLNRELGNAFSRVVLK